MGPAFPTTRERTRSAEFQRGAMKSIRWKTGSQVVPFSFPARNHEGVDIDGLAGPIVLEHDKASRIE